MAKRKIEVEIVGDAASLEKAFGKVGPAAKSVEGHLGGVHSSMSALGGVAKTAGLATGAALGGIGAAVVLAGGKFDSMKQQAEIAFTTMLGSGQKARAFLGELQSFAAKTPFEFPELVSASQKLLAMGFNAKQVVPTLTAIGDAVAGLGGSAETVDRVTVALGQMQAKGKASSEEMMQLTEAGIPAWQMLADKIGVSIPEAMKRVTAGSVDAGTAITALTEGMEKKFGGMMERQSHTFSGLLSTIKDTFTQISGTVMAPFFDLATKGMQKLVDLTSGPGLTEGISRFGEAMSSAGELASKAFGVIHQAFNELQPSLARLVSTIRSDVLPALGKIAEVVATEVLPTLLKIASAIVEHVWPVVKAMAGVYADAFSAIGKVLAEHQEELARIGNRLGKLFDALATVAVPVLRFVFTQVLPTAIGIAITAIDKISAAIGGIVTVGRAVAGRLADVWGGIERVALKTALAVVEPFSHMPAKLGGWAREAKKGILDQLSSISTKGVGTDAAAQGAAKGAAFGAAFKKAASGAFSSTTVTGIPAQMPSGAVAAPPSLGVTTPTTGSTANKIAGTAVNAAASPGAAAAGFHLPGERTPYDCSAFVQAVFAQSGIHIGSTTYTQITGGRHVDLNDLMPGDVVFFNYGSETWPGHVGIYVGNGMMVHDHGASRGVEQQSYSSLAGSSNHTPEARCFISSHQHKGAQKAASPLSDASPSAAAPAAPAAPKPKTKVTAADKLGIADMPLGLQDAAASAALTKGIADDIAVLKKWKAMLLDRLAHARSLEDKISIKKELKSVIDQLESDAKDVREKVAQIARREYNTAADPFSGREDYDKTLAAYIKKQEEAAEKAAAELKKSLGKQRALLIDMRADMRDVIGGIVDVAEQQGGRLRDAFRSVFGAFGGGALETDTLQTIRANAKVAADLMEDLGKSLTGKKFLTDAQLESMKSRITEAQRLVSEGLKTLADNVTKARDEVGKAWDAFAEHVLKVFDDQVVGQLKRSFDQLADLFSSKRQADEIRKATEVLAAAAFGDPETARMMNERIQLWRDYYQAVSDNNLELAAALQDQIIASENAFGVHLTEVAEEQKTAAGQITSAGETIIKGIQDTGADMIAATLTRWDELKGAERTKIEEAIRSAQDAVDTGQILLPEALERVKTALIAAGMNPEEADKLLHDPIANSLGEAVKALGEAVGKLTSALEEIARQFGISVRPIGDASKAAADAAIEPWVQAAARMSGLSADFIRSISEMTAAEASRLGGMKVGTYDTGGYLPTGWSLAGNFTGKPEPVGAAAAQTGGGDLHVHFDGVVFGNDMDDVASNLYSRLQEIDRRRTGGQILNGTPTLR